MFRFRKLYVDLIGRDGSVCVAYVTALRTFGVELTPSAIELYRPDGARLVRRGRARLSLDREPNLQTTSKLQFDLDGLEYVLELEQNQGEIESPPPPISGLAWNVKMATMRGRLIRSDRRETVVAGTGYADWVELTRLPRALGISRLRWGRLHLERGTIIYTQLERVGAPDWRTACTWPHGCPPRSTRDWSIATSHPCGTRQLRFGDEIMAREAQLIPERALHQGGATDTARFPSLVEHALYRALAGPTHEERWLSRAQSTAFGTGWAIHESVQFGRTA